MFKIRKLFYLLLVIVICTFGLGVLWFFLLCVILVNEDVYIIGLLRNKIGRNAAAEYDVQWSTEQFLPLST